MKNLQSSERRKVLISGVKAISLAIMGSIVWSTFLTGQTKTSFILRPPGARDEKEFLKSCIKCGLCVEACPYDTLKLAKIGDKMPIGTPFFVPRDIPCEMCTDIPCVQICPTDALDSSLVSTEKNGVMSLDINRSQMGIAVVDQDNCLAYLGIRCEACYRACPLMDKAITIEYKHNERTQKHAHLLPIVHSDACTGCGKCEKACITEKATITVLPRDAVLGSLGSNYIKGWDASDEQRLDAIQMKDKGLPANTNKGAQDYLNNEEF